MSCPTSAPTSPSPLPGAAYKFVPPTIRCRHTVGLNWTAIGVEHVGFSDQDILGRPAQLNGSLHLVQWLRCRFGIPVSQVIGHNESLSSPFYKELDPRFQGQTHGDWTHADMQIYRVRPEQARLLLRAAATMAA